MLETFPSGSLPGQGSLDPHIYTDTDVASFQDIWLAADYIETCCLQSQHQPGWALVGEWRVFIPSPSLLLPLIHLGSHTSLPHQG